MKTIIKRGMQVALFLVVLFSFGNDAFAQNTGSSSFLSGEVLSSLFLFGVSVVFFILGVYYLTRKPDDRHYHFE